MALIPAVVGSQPIHIHKYLSGKDYMQGWARIAPETGAVIMGGLKRPEKEIPKGHSPLHHSVRSTHLGTSP